MSLSYNLTGIKDHEEVCFWAEDDGKRYMSPLTEALISRTMSVGIPEITEDNVEEFFGRVSVVDIVFGSTLRLEDGDPYYISMDDIRQHVGLSTNASRKSSEEFGAHLGRRYFPPSKS